MLPKCSSPPALPGTDPAPLQGNPQAVMSMSAPTPGPSKEGEVPSLHLSATTTTHYYNHMKWGSLEKSRHGYA